MDFTKVDSTYLPTTTSQPSTPTYITYIHLPTPIMIYKPISTTEDYPTASLPTEMTSKPISIPEDFPSASLPTEMASKPTSTPEDLQITLTDLEVITNYFQRLDELRNQDISWIHSDFKPLWICGNFRTTMDGRTTCSSLHYFTTSSPPVDSATSN